MIKAQSARASKALTKKEIRTLFQKKDKQLIKSTKEDMINPISKCTIRIDGFTYDKLIGLGCFLTDDDKLDLNNR